MKTGNPISFESPAAGSDPLSKLATALLQLLFLPEIWRRRHQASMQFARIETRLLRDAGISDSRRFVEINKAFWEE